MARYFEVNNNTPTVKLDSQGRATVQYKVKNVSATPIDGRAVLVSLPLVTPPAGAVQKGWLKLDTPPDHHFENNEETVYSVRIEVPPKDRVAAATYTFRLDAVLVSVPDRGDPGPATAFSFDAKAAPKPNKLLWLVPLILLVVVGIGVGLWLLLRGGGKVPDVTGKTMTEAVASLADAKLTVDPKVTTASVDPKLAGKVITQDPAAGVPAQKNGSVHLTLGASKTLVPLLTGKTVAEAQTFLSSNQLALGNVSNQVNGAYPAGIVFGQSQVAGTQVDTNTSVNVVVTPQQVTVPNVVGKGLSDASTLLRQSSLQLGNIGCDLLASPVQSQTPSAGAAAGVGSQVNVMLPCSTKSNQQVLILKGSALQKSFVVSPLAHNFSPVPQKVK